MPDSAPPARVVLVVGVAGSGKTTVGAALAARLAARTGRPWVFVDADDVHDPAATAKMARGEGLTDADRAPWLARLAALVRARLDGGPPTVLACSALRATYRETLTGGDARVAVVWLDAPPGVLAARLVARRGHAVGPGLLPSQLATWEPPADSLPRGGGALRLDATRPVEALVEALVEETVGALASTRDPDGSGNWSGPPA